MVFRIVQPSKKSSLGDLEITLKTVENRAASMDAIPGWIEHGHSAIWVSEDQEFVRLATSDNTKSGLFEDPSDISRRKRTYMDLANPINTTNSTFTMRLPAFSGHYEPRS